MSTQSCKMVFHSLTMLMTIQKLILLQTIGIAFVYPKFLNVHTLTQKLWHYRVGEDKSLDAL